MKQFFLKIYDKIILLSIAGCVAILGGCCKKVYPDQKQKDKDLSPRIDTTTINDKVIALYGVRPTEQNTLEMKEKK